MRGLLIGALAGGLALIGLPGVATAQPASAPAGAPFPASTTVTLITGDRVTVSPGGNGTLNYAFHPVAGASNQFESYQDATGDHYIVPAIAVPYVGRQLDRALFDVSALVRDGLTGNANIPVNLSFAAGVAPTAPAGVTLTATSGGTARGYLTPASGTAFAAALRAQIGADITAGHQAGTAPLFGGLAGMSLGAGGATAAAQPRYPLYVLQVTATDVTGAAANGAEVIVVNTDSVRKEYAPVVVNSGIGRIAVPAGNYSAISVFVDYDTKGNATALRTVLVGDFAVTAGATNTVAVDERTATAQLTAGATPRPATAQITAFTVIREDSAGSGAEFALFNLGAATTATYASPQGAVHVGKLHYLAEWDGSAPKATDNYRYDLAVGGDTIPADLTIPASADKLATVKQRLYADPAPGGTFDGFLAGATDPVSLQFGYAQFGGSVNTPAVLTDYVGAGDGDQWLFSYVTPNGVFLNASPHTYPAGTSASVDWGRAPLAAGLGQYSGSDFCEACVAGSTFSLAIPMFRDSVPDHNGSLFPSGAKLHFTLSRDGTTLVDQDNIYGASVQNIPATPSTYLGVEDLDTTGLTGFSQGVKSHTEETVRYQPANPGPALPASDSCVDQTATTACAILPAMTLDYRLAPLDLTNTSNTPVQALVLNVGHVGYLGVQAHSMITSATVSVSFDNGGTWQPVPVFGFAGHYAAVWQNPASARGTSPTLKVTATDAAGDAISQTVTNAYTIAKAGS